MKESEKEEAKIYLELVKRLYNMNKSAIHEITLLNQESSHDEWNKAYSDENVKSLMMMIEPLKEIPKTEVKELKKLMDNYSDLIACCLKAGHLYLHALSLGKLSKLQFAKIVYWVSLSAGLLAKFQQNLEKIQASLS